MKVKTKVFELQARLNKLKNQFSRIARNNENLTVPWLLKFAKNPNPNPTTNKIDALEKALGLAEKWPK